jgi:hypothetical protein
MILKETYHFLRTRYKDQIEGIIISDVCIGLHLAAVRLSDVVSQGGAGFHLFKYCAKKIFIINES